MAPRRLSIRGPVTLFAIVLVLVVTLAVLWNIVLVQEYRRLQALAQEATIDWPLLLLGTGLFLTIIVLSSVLGAQLFGHIRWRQRQSNFIASVSHELNSPLSSIKLFAQTLRRHDLSRRDRRSFVDKILFDVERLARLISNILRAAELDSRGEDLQVVRQTTELGPYLESFLEDARALHVETGLRASLSMDHSVSIFVDRILFRQVLDNLIDNAVRYRGESSPSVEVEVAGDSQWIAIHMRDRGIGVDSTELPKLFDRFFRVDHRTPSKKRGTGIGLFIVRSIVEAHGGKVSAHSDGPGCGTTFSIRLPVAEEPS